MEQILLKVQPVLFEAIEQYTKDNGYTNKQEFIREAIRDKLNKQRSD